MRKLVYVLTVLIYVGLVAFVVWFLAIRPHQPITDKLQALLQLVAAYTFLLGFLFSAGLFKAFDSLQRDLTSRDPMKFLAANLLAFALIFESMSVALDSRTTSSIPRFLLGIPILLGAALLVLAYAIVHFLAIVPIAYFGYLVTSVPIDAIINSSSDLEITQGRRFMRIKETIQKNETTVRNFAVAVPAFLLSFVVKIGPLLPSG